MTRDELLSMLHRYRESYVTSTNGGRQVHAAWRDAMLAQGRAVVPQRMEWDTLDIEDKWLDHEIARLVVDDYLSWVFDQMVHEQVNGTCVA